MSLVSTLASFLYAALPQPVRAPSPRRSEGLREFDAFMHELDEVEPLPRVSFPGTEVILTRRPYQGPRLAVERRAHHG